MTQTNVGSNNKWWTLIAVCIATFMLLLDVTIVNVALKSIQNDLGSTFSDLQWVVDAYALTLASFLLTFGSLADLFGRKRIFLGGIAWFTLSSLGCALAVNPLMLNLCRASQGIGAAAMFATALALIAQEFRGKERGTAFGIWGAVTGGAVAVGPLIGGALTDGFGWQSIFYVNVPVGVIALVLTLWKVTDQHVNTTKDRIDFVGFFTFSISLFLLIMGLVRGNLDGWGSPKIVGCFVGAAILLIVFLVAEMRRRDPMFDLSLFRNSTFDGAAVAALTLSASIFSLFLYITLYFQIILGYSPLQTGIRFLPTTVLSFFVAAASGKASAYVPAKVLLGAGLGCIGLGLVLVAAMIQNDSSWTAVMPGLCLAGFGIGLTNPPLASTAVSVVPPEKSGMASGINSTFRQVGIATGIAGLGAVFQHLITSGVTGRLSSVLSSDQVSNIAGSVTNGKVSTALEPLSGQLKGIAAIAVRDSFVHSFRIISLIASLIAFAGAVFVVLTVKTKAEA